jgi:hypothetical protein
MAWLLSRLDGAPRSLSNIRASEASSSLVDDQAGRG